MVGMWTWVAGHVCAQDVCTKGRVRAVPPQPCVPPTPGHRQWGLDPGSPPVVCFVGQFPLRQGT